MKICFAGELIPRRDIDLDQNLQRYIKDHDFRIFCLPGKNKNDHLENNTNSIYPLGIPDALFECFNSVFITNNFATTISTEEFKKIISICKTKGISTIGIVENKKNVSIHDIDNCRIIAINEVARELNSNNRSFPEFSKGLKCVEKIIKKGKKLGKLIIIVTHKNNVEKPIPSSDTRKRYRSWIKFGAELIVATQPSIVHGHEIYMGKHIFYSLGNPTFENLVAISKNSDDWGIMLSVDTESGELNIVPISMNQKKIINPESNAELILKYQHRCKMIEKSCHNDDNSIFDQSENKVIISETPKDDSSIAKFGIESYSQEGEDMVLRRIFENQPIGFYVDVGAHHPSRFSNTYYFYKNGWQGINIDAMPGSMTLFNKFRSRDINLEIAISDKERMLDYYIFNEPALNGFSKELSEDRCKLSQYKIIKVIKLETQTLSSVLDNFHIARKIDFLSVDAEGLDYSILNSNDWNKYRPKVVLVELLNQNIDGIFKDKIYNLLANNGYLFFSKCVNTAIFIENNFCKARFDIK